MCTLNPADHLLPQHLWQLAQLLARPAVSSPSSYSSTRGLAVRAAWQSCGWLPMLSHPAPPCTLLHSGPRCPLHQVGFHDQKRVRYVTVPKRLNEIVNRLNKTKDVGGAQGGSGHAEGCCSYHRLPSWQ